MTADAALASAMTPALAAAALYVGLCALILLGLAAHVVRVRVRRKIFMGDGGDPQMIRAMRGQANLVEYAPFAAAMLTLGALLGAPAAAIHLFGAAFVLGRVLHAWHFIQDDAPRWQRFWGSLLTLLSMLFGALGLIVLALIHL